MSEPAGWQEDKEEGGSMHALRVHEQGRPTGRLYDEVLLPEPGIGDVLVRVHAASFTPTEFTWLSTGWTGWGTTTPTHSATISTSSREELGTEMDLGG
jgi:hypothetical protein